MVTPKGGLFDSEPCAWSESIDSVSRVFFPPKKEVCMQNDATKPMLGNLEMEEELSRLNRLDIDCAMLLNDWKAFNPNCSDASPDAVVALIVLHQNIRERRSYILGFLQQADLPF